MSLSPGVLVVTGPSGSGKTTVGREVATRLGWPFVDADDLHPTENIERMRAGLPLTDDLREPWLERLSGLIRTWIDRGEAKSVARTGTVLACSALKRAHRETLASGRPEVRFVFLNVDVECLKERLAAREGHFMPATLLKSQLEALEAPRPDEPVWTIPADGTVAETVTGVLERLRA